MSELIQIPNDGGDRGVLAPNNGGYVLYKTPGFREEQNYFIVNVKGPTSNSPKMVSTRIMLNFPGVKLGRDNYVLSLITANIKITPSVPYSYLNPYIRNNYIMMVSGLGDTYKTEGLSSNTMSGQHIWNLPIKTPYPLTQPSGLMPWTLTYFNRFGDTREKGVIGIHVPQDTLNLALYISDEGGFDANFDSNPRIYPVMTQDFNSTGAAFVASGQAYGNFTYTMSSPHPVSNSVYNTIRTLNGSPTIGNVFRNSITYTQPTATIPGTWTGTTLQYNIDGEIRGVSGSTLVMQISAGASPRAIQTTGFRVYHKDYAPRTSMLLGTNDGVNYTTLFRNESGIQSDVEKFMTYTWPADKFFSRYEYVIESIHPSTNNATSLLVSIDDFRLLGFEFDLNKPAMTFEREFIMCIKPSPMRERYF